MTVYIPDYFSFYVPASLALDKPRFKNQGIMMLSLSLLIFSLEGGIER